MTVQRLQPGDLVRYDGAVHRVEALKGTLVMLRERDTGMPWAAYSLTLFAGADFVSGTEHRAPEPVAASAETDVYDIDTKAMLDVLDPKLLAEAEHRETVVRALIEAHDDDMSDAERKAKLTARVIDSSRELGVDRATVWRWIKRYREDGLWGLVDQRSLRASLRLPFASVDERIIAAARTQIAVVEDQDATGAAPFARFCRRLQARLDNEDGPPVKLPPRATMHRIFAALTLGRLTGPADRRKTEASRPSRPYGHAHALRPGEVVMIDSTTFDVLAYDPLTDTVSTIELTLAIDVAPRSLLAWRFTPKGAKAVDAAMLLADILTPEPMRPGWPDALSFKHLGLACDRLVELDDRIAHAAARPYVLPETINVDHAKIYMGKVFPRACERLGISIQPARKARPTDKAIVERVFRTINSGFAQHVAGYKGRRVADRGASPQLDALWTIAELEEMFAEWVVSVYSRRPHRGLVLPGELAATWCPNDAYAEAVARAGWIPVPSDPALYFDLLPIVWRTATRSGFENDGLTYWNDQLGDLDLLKSPYPGQGRKWPLRVDPRSPINVFFQLPSGERHGEWIALRWTHAPDMLAPFTDVTLSFVRRKLRERGLNPKDQDEVQRAMLDLQNRTDAPWASTAMTRRAMTRDRDRARATQRDQARAGMHIPDERDDDERGLYLVDSGEHADLIADGDPPVRPWKLDDLEPFETL